MISALCWIPQGAAQKNPEKLQLSEQEYEQIASKIGAHVDDAKMMAEFAMEQEANLMDTMQDEDDKEDVVEDSKDAMDEDGDELKKYNLDSYDDEGQTGN